MPAQLAGGAEILSRRKRLLFVCYGGGHVRMVLPVARVLAASDAFEPVVLALTTAAPVARREPGLCVLQFKDFVTPQDEAALAHGQRLLTDLPGPVDDPEESVAYLGLSYQDLVQMQGATDAAALYSQWGRQAFLPVPTLERILRVVGPDMVVATNSPRAERAAVLAARRLGLPAVCLVDLFALDEVRWIGTADYADRVCVLNAAVRDFLLQAGRRPDQVIVTGNPAFDALADPASVQSGRDWRRAQGWQDKQVVLWASQTEPAVHPFNGLPGDPGLPARVLEQLLAWAQAGENRVLCVRPRPGEAVPALLDHERILVTGQDQPLTPLLHAVDLVVTLTSTVGLEGHLAGARLIQVQGSVFDEAMPFAAYGISDASVPLVQLVPALEGCLSLGRRRVEAPEPAAGRVAVVIREILDASLRRDFL